MGTVPIGSKGFYSPWKGSRGADKSDISSLMFLIATTFEAFSFHPPLCCCCRGCHSVLKNGDLPHKAAAAASAPCPCECLMQLHIGITPCHHKATYNHPITTLITEAKPWVLEVGAVPYTLVRDSRYHRKAAKLQKLSLDSNSDHCIKPVVLKLLHRELATAEYFLEVDGCSGPCGESGDVANITVYSCSCQKPPWGGGAVGVRSNIASLHIRRQRWTKDLLP